jgi:transcriptional regulator with XRE-family HTH domain
LSTGEEVITFDLLLWRALKTRPRQDRKPNRTIKPNGKIYIYDRDFPSRRKREQRYAESLNEIGVRIGKLAGRKSVDKSQLMSWRSGKHVPRRSTVQAIAPALKEIFGIPAEQWLRAREISRTLVPYDPNDGKAPRTKCDRGHSEPSTGWLPGGRCPVCTARSRDRSNAAYRERNAEKHCSACGRKGVHQADLCGSCYKRQYRYGDPLIPSRREKLSADEVRAIRRNFTGELGQQTQLAEQYRVTPSVISNVIWRKTYRKVN